MMREWLARQQGKLESMPCSQRVLVKLLLWCSVRVFGYVMTWSPPEEGGELKAVGLAVDERHFNSFSRECVDALDERYVKNKT